MGRNNRQRRAAKKRRRQQAGRGGGPANRPTPADGATSPVGGSHPRPGPRREAPPLSTDELLWAAIAATRIDGIRFETAMRLLVDRLEDALVLADQQLVTAIDELWGKGWTPGDLVHVITRRSSIPHADLVADHVVADGRRRAAAGQSLHPRWLGQLDELDRGAPAGGSPSDDEQLRLLVEVLRLVLRLPTVQEVVPAPGSSVGAPAAAAKLDPKLLARVRALLAKAESTTFDDEAEACTAKAQELIARHAIDDALLHTTDDVGEPAVRRLLIDDPYADAKANLLAAVAGANRCMVVSSPGLGWVTAFGFDHDLDAVELLSASLLTQATAAMLRHGSRRDAAGRSRTRSFRRSFLLGFAQRIGQRLREAADGQVTAAGAHAARFAPVLAARDDRVQAAAQAAFPELVQRTVSVSNATGWSAGRVAAELADLGVSARRLADG